MGKLIRSRPVVVGVALVVIIAGGVVLKNFMESRTAGSGGLSWATGVVSQGPIEVTVSGSAALQPGSVSDVRTTVSGTVRRVLVANGDSVTAGTPLVELENESVLLDWEQARLTYEEEYETLAELQSGSLSSSTALRTAELRVQQALKELNDKQKLADDLEVLAGSAGLITTVDVEAGDEVKAGTQLLSLLEGPRVEASLAVPETDIDRVATGDRAALILGPLPQVHTITIHTYEPAVYNLRIGDSVKATIDGKWPGFINQPVSGRVVEIVGGTTFFEITCRLPAVPDSVPAGATVNYMQIFPSGDKGDATVLTASGKLDVETDVWGLETEQAEGDGLSGRVTEIASKGIKSQDGNVTYAVQVALDQYPDEARDGMTVHACIWPESGYMIAGVTTIELPAASMTTASGGTVSFVAVKPGDAVTEGQLLAQLSNETVLQQLEQAYIDLETAEETLAKLQVSGETDRKLRLQEIRTRQAELTLADRLASVEGLTVTAPQDGVISSLNEDIGQGVTVGSGASVCRILNYEDMEMVISIDELEVALIEPGMSARVAVDAFPGKTFLGEVVDVAQEGTYQSGVSKFEVTLRVEASPQLRAQMTATATIEIASKESALLVPAEAVAFLGDGSGEVSVVGPGGQISQAEIEVGLYNDSQVEVLSGLKAGDIVITGTTDDAATGAGGFMGGPGMIPGETVRPGSGTTIIRPKTGQQTGPR